MVRHSLKILQQKLQDFQPCLTILGRYAVGLKSSETGYPIIVP